MKLKIIWEQHEIPEIELDEDGLISPLCILEKTGVEGRKVFMEILMINYREEFKNEFKDLLKFERRSLK